MTQAAHPAADLRQVYIGMRPAIIRYALRRLREAHAAEDIASEVFLRLERVTEAIPTETEAQHYIWRVAKNLLIDYARVNNRRFEIVQANSVLLEDEMPNVEQGMIAQADLAIIHEAFDDLPHKARDIVYYARVAGMTHQQIADRMGISKSLVEKYIIRAMRHFRERLREAHDVPDSPAAPAAAPVVLRVVAGGRE